MNDLERILKLAGMNGLYEQDIETAQERDAVKETPNIAGMLDQNDVMNRLSQPSEKEQLKDDLAWVVITLDSEAKNNMSPEMKKIRRIINRVIEVL